MRASADGVAGSGADSALSGALVGGPSRRAATFGTGRVCEEEGCSTRLSMYNSRTRCAAHDFDASLMNFRCPTHPQAAATPAESVRSIRPPQRQRRRLPSARRAA